MNAATLSIQKARALVANLRASHSSGHGWDGRVDRDLVREAHEIYLLAHATSPRVI